MKDLSVFSDAQVHGFKEKRIMQHNAITSGRYDFSACQLDILFMLLASLTQKELQYRITAKDIELITGRAWNYAQLRKATEEIGNRMFEVDIKQDNGKMIYRQMWLFQQVDYLEGQGAFEVMISEPAKPYFFELKNSFTSIQLKSVLACSSKYAKRLYTLACQWRSVGRQVYEIEELKRMLGMIDKKGNEQYRQIGQFKKDVLDIAKEQINANTDLKFDYKLHKKGRSFKVIEIFIDISANFQLQIDFQKPIAEQKDIKYIMSYGLTEKQATQIAENEKIENFKSLIDELNQKVRKGDLKVDNSRGYIVGVYKKKGVISSM
ncbi:replication initiation protein [Flavimarina sp. Hel_I_48]|uniref:replication initiation protein n=1 Tax=Flavimarina sp. Hel_I_48 TaxID=1392488 RepID=UPI000689C6D3|nr:replication initiation protein [Flavimarina sp. Hel_I_48]